jgi:tRNA nucleotidyltransferase (CCA-adding enzyme)
MMIITPVIQVVKTSKQMTIYRVGGYVRDKLLGLKPYDCDYVVTGSSPEKMLQLGYTQVGRSFPVFLHPTTKEEYALARTEKKISSGHTGFSTNSSSNVTLEQDLSRRDITINAIAEDMNGEIIDPFNGVQDLRDHIIRHVSAAFSEDPLRILRVARFAARFNFKIADETLELLTTMGINQDGLALSRERILNELDKALSYQYTSRFFKVLIATKNLAVFFPTLAKVIECKNKQNQFISTLEQLTNTKTKYLFLAYILAANNFKTNENEFSTDKKKLTLMKHATLIFEFLAQQSPNQSNDEQILDLLKKSNALRDQRSFLQLLQLLAELPYYRNDNSRLILKLLEELSLVLIQLNFSDLANSPAGQTIQQAVKARQLSTINQIRTNYGI